MIARVAEALRLDPLDVRRKNLYREGQHQRLRFDDAARRERGAGARPLHRRSGASPLPRSRRPGTGRERRGVGFASGIKNVGYSFGFPEQCTARCR
jgi:CO/xanthine dehydrogenase Mo-binding subunit